MTSRIGADYAGRVEVIRAVLVNVTQNALRFAQQLVAYQGSYVWLTHADLEFDTHGQTAVVQRYRPDTRLAAISASREQLGSQQLATLVEAASASATWNARFFYDKSGSVSREWQIGYAVLQPFLLRYAELAPDFGWRADIFDRVWQELSAYAQTGEARVLTISVLHNLELEVDLDLGHAGQLQRLTPAAKQVVWREVRSRVPMLLGQAYLEAPQSWDAELRTVLAWRQGDPSATQCGRQQHERALMALRLLGPGRVAMSVTYSMPAGPGGSFALGAGLEDLVGAGAPQLGETCRLSAIIGPRLRLLIAACDAEADDARLAFAFRRFAMSYDRERPDDHLVDGWIALESLYGDPAQREGIAERLADRMSMELESDDKKRSTLRRKVLSYYDIRSRLVHGNSDLPPETVAKVAKRTNELLRRALVRRLGVTPT